MSGSDFNSIFANFSFVKLTNATELHNNHQFITGINVDEIPFNSKSQCTKGGFYFTEISDIHRWLWYRSEVGIMKYIRNVLIPDNACVYIECDAFKSDIIVLAPSEIVDQQIYVDAIKKGWHIYCHIPNDMRTFEINRAQTEQMVREKYIEKYRKNK